MYESGRDKRTGVDRPEVIEQAVGLWPIMYAYIVRFTIKYTFNRFVGGYKASMLPPARAATWWVRELCCRRMIRWQMLGRGVIARLRSRRRRYGRSDRCRRLVP